MSFIELDSYIKKLGYERFFGPKLANCLDNKGECPKCLLFVRNEERIPNQNWDFALLHQIESIKDLSGGLCQVRSKVKLYSFDFETKKATFLSNNNDKITDFQVFIIKECFLVDEKLLQLKEIQFN